MQLKVKKTIKIPLQTLIPNTNLNLWVPGSGKMNKGRSYMWIWMLTPVHSDRPLTRADQETDRMILLWQVFKTCHWLKVRDLVKWRQDQILVGKFPGRICNKSVMREDIWRLIKLIKSQISLVNPTASWGEENRTSVNRIDFTTQVRRTRTKYLDQDIIFKTNEFKSFTFINIINSNRQETEYIKLLLTVIIILITMSHLITILHHSTLL